MSFFSKYLYYARSLVTLGTRFARPDQIAAIFLGRPNALPAEITLRREGWRFVVGEVLDVWVIKETCVDRDYTRDVQLEPGWQVVDIGAGLGDFSIFAASHCPAGQVHAYEPLAASFELLQRNLALNQVRNVTAFNEATAPGGRVSLSGAAAGPAVSTRFSAAEGLEGVPAVDLAIIVDRLPGGRCDFLKIDCEGCEYDLLLSAAPETLARIARISAEVHAGPGDQSPVALANYLASNGFRVRRRSNPVHAELSFLYAERA